MRMVFSNQVFQIWARFVRQSGSRTYWDYELQVLSDQETVILSGSDFSPSPLHYDIPGTDYLEPQSIRDLLYFFLDDAECPEALKIHLESSADLLDTLPEQSLIAICGPARAGKSTISEWFQYNHPSEYVEISFAGPIKEMLGAMLGLCREEIDDLKDSGTIIEEAGQTARTLLQTLGTEWGRNHVNPDLWIRLAESNIRRLSAESDSVVVPDLRFRNEYLALKALGFLVIWVEREIESMLTPEERAHASESESDFLRLNADILIDNSVTKETLYSLLKTLFTRPV